MDDPFRTPLVEYFRRGEAPRDVRLVAAKGLLVPRAHEQLALLMVLTGDPDAEVVATAEATIRRLPAEPLAAFLRRPDVAPDVREFFASRSHAAPAASSAVDDGVQLAPPELEPDAGDDAPREAPAPAGQTGPSEEAEEDTARRSVAQRLGELTVADRIKAAMQGSREERAILVRDPNRLVASAVLSSPKLTESEVEAIARMSNVSEDVLRTIGTTRAWTKNYPVIAALTRNAKTPIAISLNLLARLTDRDMKVLSTDRNIPEPIRIAARKFATRRRE